MESVERHLVIDGTSSSQLEDQLRNYSMRTRVSTNVPFRALAKAGKMGGIPLFGGKKISLMWLKTHNML